MSKTVTALKNSPEEPGWVEVHLDGHASFSIRMLEAAHLKVGQTLDNPDIERFKAIDVQRQSYGCALRYLGTRSRSTREVENHLKKKHFPANAIAMTIARLREQRYLDDELFARSWVRNRARFKPRSRVILRQELKQKGISTDIINNVIETVDEVEMAWISTKKRLKSWENLTRQELRLKVLRYLNNAGYSYEVARQAFERIAIEPEGSTDPG